MKSENGWGADSFSLTEHEVKEVPMAHHRAGKTWTATGYGAKIPSTKMIKIGGRWRRIYVSIWSNSGTAWVNHGGERCLVD